MFKIMALKKWTASGVIREALEHLAIELGVTEECRAASEPVPSPEPVPAG